MNSNHPTSELLGFVMARSRTEIFAAAGSFSPMMASLAIKIVACLAVLMLAVVVIATLLFFIIRHRRKRLARSAFDGCREYCLKIPAEIEKEKAPRLTASDHTIKTSEKNPAPDACLVPLTDVQFTVYRPMAIVP